MKCVTALLLCQLASAASAGELAGTLEAEVDGQQIQFPILKTDIEADVQGDLATVTVVQTFANPLDRAVHATYLFPLNEDAAVYAMVMEVGDERIRAQIQEVKAAQQTFDSAKREGKAAALLKQHRPNMFTQRVANLMPGLPIRVEMKYTQTVPKIDGRYELAIPLVVGPRFQPPRKPKQSDAGAAPEPVPGQWTLQQLPAYPPVHGLDIPESIDADRVSIQVDVQAGVPVQWTDSNTHEITVYEASPRRTQIELAAGHTIDNRDFVLHYELAGATTTAGLLTEAQDGGGFFSILIEPPATPEAEQIIKRELVFVLDCSGSMYGLPLNASKAFMREALQNLRPDDSFRIIRFSDTATEFSRQPLPATPANVRRGIGYTDGLHGSGGTMMTYGIQQALNVPGRDDAVRIVVFLTDGYIGNELEILRLIETLRGDARLYAFGVGSGVNRYLLEEMGRVGHGFTRYMDPTEQVDDVARELAQRLDAPVLTGIEIDWGDAQVADVTPQQIPDLFAGQSVRVQGRYTRPGDHTITVRGRTRHQSAALQLPVSLPEATTAAHRGAIALIWARSAIKDAMHHLITPLERRPDGLANEDIRAQVTELGLQFSLMTHWTAFVAVSEQIYNPDPGNTRARDVPLPMVKGITARAYPQESFHGAGAPEPHEWLAIAVLLLVGLGFELARRRRVVQA